MSPSDVTIRDAATADAGPVGRIWHDAWHDGHDGHVPDELVAVRTVDNFRERAEDGIATVVAELDGDVVGFATIADDEVADLFVDASARGTGVASHLLSEAERRIALAGHDAAWLAVVGGNARARRFYERQGWRDDGPFDHQAPGPDGPILVPCRRYVKGLRP